MAKSKTERDVFDRLRAAGLRKRVARVLAQATGDGKLPKPAQKAIDDIRAVAADLERRFPGGTTPQQQAGRKAAATRKTSAAKRSSSARKAAPTRARKTGTRSTGGSRSSSSRSTGASRSSSSRSTGTRRTASSRRRGGTSSGS